jgi:trehalose/maltose hydrolase-like predicted phosphorylase
MEDSTPGMPHLPAPGLQGCSPGTVPTWEFPTTADVLWLMIEYEFTPAREHEFESLFSVSNGYLGSRGFLPLYIPLSTPMVLIAGAFNTTPPSSIPELLPAPDWALLSHNIGSRWLEMRDLSVKEHRRILDMQQGMFRREFRFSDSAGHLINFSLMRIASLADRHMLLQSGLCTLENFSGPLTIRSGFLPSHSLAGGIFPALTKNIETTAGPIRILEGQTHAGLKIGLAVTTRFSVEGEDIPELKIRQTIGLMDEFTEVEVEAGKCYRCDWLEVCYTSRDTDQPAQAAATHLQKLLQEGVNPTIHCHVDAWHRRWRTADVRIQGDEIAQRAIRFASYHLVSAANPDDERVSVGARALTGQAYKGHVFWDTEIYLLPFYTLTDPPSARALLMYRFHTLAAARNRAQQFGYKGALYAWESADTGDDVTPTYAITPTGFVLPVVTGMQAHHISADVAFAVWQYWQATEDDEFLCKAGGEILMETARFWASRGLYGSDGLYHIHKVIGPDEYHEGVDDNAYTNWMAQWNLECATAAASILKQRWPAEWQRIAHDIQLADDEPERWQALSKIMYTGILAERELIEQFKGYLDLEEIDLARYAPRSLPIDIILGRERTQGAKIIKQADVVMLLHLLWNRVPGRLREASFRYYEPRTEHGSSLSPSIHALIAARLGDMEMAMRYFRQSCEIDLSDNMGNASGGVHIASLGGIWQTVVFGFAGLNLGEDGMSFMPHCPPNWRSICFSLIWRSRRLQVHVESSSIQLELEEGSALPVAVGAASVLLEAGRIAKWELHEGSWKEIAHGDQ